MLFSPSLLWESFKLIQSSKRKFILPRLTIFLRIESRYYVIYIIINVYSNCISRQLKCTLLWTIISWWITLIAIISCLYIKISGCSILSFLKAKTFWQYSVLPMTFTFLCNLLLGVYAHAQILFNESPTKTEDVIEKKKIYIFLEFLETQTTSWACNYLNFRLVPWLCTKLQRIFVFFFCLFIVKMFSWMYNFLLKLSLESFIDLFSYRGLNIFNL